MKKKNLINPEPPHAPEGCHPDTYIRQNFPDEKPVLCSSMHGSLNLGFAKVLTVNDAIELLSRVKDKDKPLLTDMRHYCSNMSWEVYINPHDGTMASFKVPGFRSDLADGL
jgi:hypothetical protein